MISSEHVTRTFPYSVLTIFVLLMYVVATAYSRIGKLLTKDDTVECNMRFFDVFSIFPFNFFKIFFKMVVTLEFNYFESICLSL